MPHPKEAVLVNSFEVSDFGGHNAWLADVNGDKEYELLLLQSAGQFKSALSRDRNDIDDVDTKLSCLTVLSLTGKVLWQNGEPYARDYPYTSHGGQAMVSVDDVDADGKPEVMLIRGQEMLVLDGISGVQKAKVKLPSDNYTRIYTAQLDSTERGRQIIVKVNDLSYPPWEYANPIIVYNADLSIYREPFAVKGAGHNLIARDIDNDGKDELFIGYSLLDHDFTEIWTVDLPEDFNYAGEHADEVQVSDFNDDGKLEVRYAGSEDLFVTDLEGNVIWKKKAGHSQTTVEGPWGPNGEKRIILSEKWLGLWGLDLNGNILWHRDEINGYARGNVRWHREGSQKCWSAFEPGLRPIKPTPYWSDPALNKDMWPGFMNGDGEILSVFPWKDEYRQPCRFIRAKRAYDCGVQYWLKIEDLDRDGLDEILIYDRDHVWIFHSPES